MTILFNEYLIKDALYYNLTHKHTRDRDNDPINSTYAPFGTGKTIYLYDSSVVPYPTNPVDSTWDAPGAGSDPLLVNYLYAQAFDSNITIDDNATRGDARDDKIYFNTVLFSATQSGRPDWFLIKTSGNDPTDNTIVTISDSIGIPGTNSLLTISTSTVTTGQAIICWFNLSII